MEGVVLESGHHKGQVEEGTAMPPIKCRLRPAAGRGPPGPGVGVHPGSTPRSSPAGPGWGVAAMAVTTGEITDVERRQLKAYFEETRPMPQLLATLRSRRVARGYAIESGEEEVRAATGRTLR